MEGEKGSGPCLSVSPADMFLCLPLLVGFQRKSAGVWGLNHRMSEEKRWRTQHVVCHRQWGKTGRWDLEKWRKRRRGCKQVVCCRVGHKSRV